MRSFRLQTEETHCSVLIRHFFPNRFSGHPRMSHGCVCLQPAATWAFIRSRQTDIQLWVLKGKTPCCKASITFFIIQLTVIVRYLHASQRPFRTHGCYIAETGAADVPKLLFKPSQPTLPDSKIQTVLTLSFPRRRPRTKRHQGRLQSLVPIRPSELASLK